MRVIVTIVIQNPATNNIDNNLLSNSYIKIVDDDKDLLQMYYEYLTLNGFKKISFDEPLKVLDHLNNILLPLLIVTSLSLIIECQNCPESI